MLIYKAFLNFKILEVPYFSTFSSRYSTLITTFSLVTLDIYNRIKYDLIYN